MIECLFTLDYEIYGNGEGSLEKLVYEPAERLRTIFQKWDARFVIFVEVAELEMIESRRADPAIGSVKRQIRDFCEAGFELGLHLHPQWYNGKYENGRWSLDYSEYNLCALPRERIAQLCDRSIDYFRDVLEAPHYIPLSFRAGNWLFQPTQPAASVLAERGIKVDSSLYKGGCHHQFEVDYRRAAQNGYYWKFTRDVNEPEQDGALLELPIHTRMVPAWKMLTGKRIGFRPKVTSAHQNGNGKIHRVRDLLRFQYPLKFDFCRMTISELGEMVDRVILKDEADPKTVKPIVAIGHTKDLMDYETIESFLSYLDQKKIRVSTFNDIYSQAK